MSRAFALLFSRSWAIVALVPLSAALLAGCAQTSSRQQANAAPAITLSVTKVVRRDMMQVVTIPGLVSALPDHSLKVSSAIAGKLVEVHVQPGDSVSKGEVIAKLDARQINDQVQEAVAAVKEGQQAVAQAQTNLKLGEDTYNRQLQLFSDRIAAKKDVVAAEAQYKTDIEQVKAAKAHVLQLKATQAQMATQLTLTNIVSPVSGVVASRFLNIGDNSDPNTPVVHIVNLSTVIIEGNLPADAPAQLSPGQPASVHAAALGTRFLPATIDSVSPSVDTTSNTLPVRLLCKNPQGSLKEGQAVSVSILTGVHKGALSIPKTAIVPNPDQSQGSMVYTYNRRTAKVTSVAVKTGIENKGLIEIVSGLADGQYIVANGAYGLPDGTRVAARWEWLQ